MRNRWPSEIRLLAFGAAFVALSWVVVWRLGQLQIERHEHYSARAQGQHFKRLVIQPERGEITDAKGRILATSVGRLSVYVDPRRLPGDPEGWAGLFSEALGISHERARSLLRRTHIVPMARRLSPERAFQAVALCSEFDIPDNALWFHRETQRVYPRATASHLLGYCSTDGDGDNIGMAGVELQYNEHLNGRRLTLRLERSAIRTVLSPAQDSAFLQARGETLRLTIDAVLQEATERILREQVEKFQADAGVVVVMATKTGAIRAMSSFPDFDNNQFFRATPAQRRNRCLTDPIEPGSTAKIFNLATAFDLNLYNPNDLIDCRGGFMVIHGRRIVDSPGNTLHWGSVREIFRYSSNVGSVLMAQCVEPKDYYNQLRLYGLGRPTGIDLPGEGSGLLRSVERWSRMSMSSLPMGYEMALTPVQIATAVSGIVNDGELMRPHVVAERRDARGSVVWRARPEALRRIVRPSTSAMVRELMEDVILHGTGKKAQIDDYRTGGKTGTTRKSQIFDRREYISSFVGVVPIDDPELTIYCAIDNPKGAYYASEVVAPVFKQVALVALAQLAIAPTGPPLNRIASAGTPGALSARARQQTASTAATSSNGPHLESERLVTGPGEFPDLAGLTMDEVRQALRGLDLDVRFVGSGRVVDQSPIPGTLAKPGARAVFVFRDSRAPIPEVSILASLLEAETEAPSEAALDEHLPEFFRSEEPEPTQGTDEEEEDMRVSREYAAGEAPY